MMKCMDIMLVSFPGCTCRTKNEHICLYAIEVDKVQGMVQSAILGMNLSVHLWT